MRQFFNAPRFLEGETSFGYRCSLLQPILIISNVAYMQPYAAYPKYRKCSLLQPYFSTCKIRGPKSYK